MNIGISFGRYNPPHIGHKRLWEIAAGYDDFYIGTNSNTYNKENPIRYNIKVGIMMDIFPLLKGHILDENNILYMCSTIYNKCGMENDIKICSEEKWVLPLLNKYNGINEEHGYYKFNSYELITTERISSASMLRKALNDGNRDLFDKNSGILYVCGISYYDYVKKYINS